MTIAQSTAADVAVILSHRHDQGADWWTTPDRKLLKGAPFTTLESALYLMELGVTPQHEALEAVAQLIFDAWREDGRIKTAPSGGLYPCHTALAANVCEGLGLSNFAFSFRQLLLALEGGATSADSRLGYYLTALEGFARSPITGSMFGGEKLLSQHSDILDAMSGTGVLGTALMGGMVWLMGRGALRDLTKSPARAHLVLTGIAVGVTALLGTVVYSRDIAAVTMMGALLILEGDAKRA